MTWNYRVFREENGEHIIREVFYDEDGTILSCTADAVEPMGASFEELAQDLDWFKEALQLPVLTLAEVDAIVTARPSKPKRERGKTISHEELITVLGLESEDSHEPNPVVELVN